jgi:hypothetical protein
MFQGESGWILRALSQFPTPDLKLPSIQLNVKSCHIHQQMLIKLKPF